MASVIRATEIATMVPEKISSKKPSKSGAPPVLIMWITNLEERWSGVKGSVKCVFRG